jgi:hypothetical protein
MDKLLYSRTSAVLRSNRKSQARHLARKWTADNSRRAVWENSYFFQPGVTLGWFYRESTINCEGTDNFLCRTIKESLD